jgi:hypothetical protein
VTIYEAYLISPVGLERIVPIRWMLRLPAWAKAPIAGIASWQWLGLVVGLAVCLGFPAYSVLAGLGVGGLAVALAARDSLANLLGSMLIMIEKPFRVGHYVRVRHRGHGRGCRFSQHADTHLGQLADLDPQQCRRQCGDREPQPSCDAPPALLHPGHL